MTAEEKRRAIVWDTIERLAFQPDDRQKWLRIYQKTLHSFWQVEPPVAKTPSLCTFEAVFLNLECKCSVESNDKYSVSIVSAATATPFCWCVHVDPAYCSKASFYASPGKFPHQDLAKHLRYDVECVLDGMIFHPRTHAHGNDLGIKTRFDGDGPALSTHEVRLGGGVENAFVFLTHLRYQFCLLPDEARNQERTRMVDLFTLAIRNKHTVITPSELFDFKKYQSEHLL
jgi:hypothetical protein